MKKKFYVLLTLILIAIVVKGATYKTNTPNVNTVRVNHINVWTNESTLALKTFVASTELPNNIYNIYHDMNFGGWSAEADGSTFTVESGGTLRLNSTDNINITVKAGGILIITGDITQTVGGTNKIVNYGTTTISGNITNLASIETRGTGTTTITGSVDNTSIITADAGAITVGTAGVNKNITNTNITIGAGSSMQLYGNLTETDPANQTFTNNGTANITGKIQIGTTTNSGTLTVGNIDKMNNPNTVTVTNTGTMTVTTAQTYNNGERRTINNSGTLNFNSSLSLQGAQNLMNNTGILNIAGPLDVTSGNISTIGNATVSGNVTVNGASMNGGNLTVSGSLIVSGAGTATIGSSAITGNISIDNSTLSTKVGSVSTASTLVTSNASTITNNGSLTFSTSAGTLNGNVTLNNNGSITFPGDLTMGNTSTLNNTGTANIGGTYKMTGNTKYLNGLPATATINIGNNLDIDVSEFTKSINYGIVNVGAAMKYSNGTLDNMKGSIINVDGTGSFLNSTVHIANAGTIDFTESLKVTNTTINNKIGADNGYISAHGGIALENLGCIVGGSVDFWGTITHNLHPCPGANCYNPATSANCPLAVTTTLPIELANITAQRQIDGNLIQWTVSTETNNAFFQIEVSSDGRTYKTLGTIEGAGNSTIETNYSFIHTQPSVGINYYRLSQTDFDGQKRYFAPIAVHYSNIEALIYPTVIHGDDIVHVQLSSVNVDVPFKIVSQDGKIIKTGIITSEAELPCDVFQFGVNQLIIGSDNSIISTNIARQ